MVATIFQGATFRLPLWTSVSIFALGFYLLLRASDSPVAYFAREDAALIVASFLVYAGVLGCCGTARRRCADLRTVHHRPGWRRVADASARRRDEQK